LLGCPFTVTNCVSNLIESTERDAGVKSGVVVSTIVDNVCRLCKGRLASLSKMEAFVVIGVLLCFFV